MREDYLSLARKIADRLFVNGAGEKAKRLVLELPERRDGGGWCYASVVAQIVTALHEQSAPESLPGTFEKDEQFVTLIEKEQGMTTEQARERAERIGAIANNVLRGERRA